MYLQMAQCSATMSVWGLKDASNSDLTWPMSTNDSTKKTRGSLFYQFKVILLFYITLI